MADDFEGFFEQPADEAEVESAETAESTEAEATGATSALEQTDVVATEEEESPTEAEPGEEPSTTEEVTEPERQIPFAAYEAERKKRQEFQSSFLELQKLWMESQKAQNTPVSAEEQESLEDRFYRDPAGTLEEMKESIREEMTAKFKEEANAKDIASIKARAEELRKDHPDYNEAYKVFIQALSQMPQLEKMARASGDPVKWGYEWGKNSIAMNKYGNTLPEIMENMRKEALEQARAEITKELAASSVAALPKTQAGAQSVQKSASVTDYDPLQEALKGNPFD